MGCVRTVLLASIRLTWNVNVYVYAASMKGKLRMHDHSRVVHTCPLDCV